MSAQLRLAASGRACAGKLGERYGHHFKAITDRDSLAVGWFCRRCGLTFFVDAHHDGEAS